MIAVLKIIKGCLVILDLFFANERTTASSRISADWCYSEMWVMERK